MPGSSPSSPSRTLRHQHRQQATFLPSWGNWGGLEGGRMRARLPGGSSGLSQAAAGCAPQRWASQPSLASLPLDAKRTFPHAKETPNPFLPHPVPPSTLSPSPQPGAGSTSGDAPCPPTKAPSRPLRWHGCPPRDILTDGSGTQSMGVSPAPADARPSRVCQGRSAGG